MSDAKEYLHELIKLGTDALPPEHAPVHPDLVYDAHRAWQMGSLHVEPPPGYKFPVDAVQDLGIALFEDDWTDNGMRVAFLKIQHLPELVSAMFQADGTATAECVAQFGEAYDALRTLMMQYQDYERLPPAGPQFCRDDWDYLRENQEALRMQQFRGKMAVDEVIKALCNFAAKGDVGTVYRPKGGGRPEEIPPDWWQLDNPRFRLRSCGLDPKRPFDPFAPPTAWFFFHEAELGLAIERSREVKIPYELTTDSLQGVHLSPYLKLMIEVAELTQIGPEPDQQVPVESLRVTIQEVADKRGLGISERDLGKLATFIREPGMKEGGRRVLAEARRRASQGNG